VSDNLGRQFQKKVIGHDYDPYDGNRDYAVSGTFCPKCHKAALKSDPQVFEGRESSPIYKEDMQRKDPKPKKSYYVQCSDCGKDIWGKPDLD
jgi:hypothetical protein